MSKSKQVFENFNSSEELLQQTVEILMPKVIFAENGDIVIPTCTGIPGPEKNDSPKAKGFEQLAQTRPEDDVDEKGLGATIGRLRGRRYLRRVQADPNAIDGDEDGMVQDGTTAERPAPKGLGKIRGWISLRSEKRNRRSVAERENLAGLFESIKQGGFSFSLASNSNVSSGWAVARSGEGIAMPVSDFFDADGNPTEEGKETLLAFILMQSDKLFGNQSKDKKVVLGGWNDPETGMVYFDVTDVYSKDSTSLEEAIAFGKKENQISIGDLDEIAAAVADGDWSRTTTHQSDGNGGSVIPLDNLAPYLEYIRKNNSKRSTKESEFRVVRADDGVDMIMTKPAKKLAAYHGDKREDWSDVRAVSDAMRAKIADFYDDAPDVRAEEMREETRRAFEALRDEVNEQYRILVEELKVKIEFVDDDPYENFEEMARDFNANNRLKILKTSVTGGHPFMTDEENDRFRAVHDAFGHLATGRGFDRHGEEAAYQAHRSMFSALAAQAAATELRGQNSFLIARGEFGPQKLVLLPEEWQKSLARFLRLVTKAALPNAQRSSDADNAYAKTGSHHVSCGRAFRN